jgi:hypothetical protein
VAIQINPARGAEEFPNPFAVANLFHYLALAIAGGAGMWLGVQATSDGIDARSLFVAIVLIFIGLLHGHRAWRDSYFAIVPEQVRPLGGKDAKESKDYVRELIETGIPISGKLDGAVANMLLRKAPGLRHAPELIQRFAISESGSGLRALALFASFAFAMVLTRGQPGQVAIAALYFLVTVKLLRPVAAFQRIRRGSERMPEPVVAAKVQAAKAPAASAPPARGASDLAWLAIAVIFPLIGRVVSGVLGQVPQLALLPSSLVYVTGALLLAAIAVGALCFTAIIAQTRQLQRSKAEWSLRPLPMGKADVDMVFNRLDTHLEGVIGSTSRHRLPAFPLTSGNPGIPASGAGQFHGWRVLESAVESSLGPSGGSVRERTVAASGDRMQRPMLLLDMLGIVLFAAGVVLLYRFAVASSMGSRFALLVTGAGFLAAAEQAFATAHLLWQRFEFLSEVVWVEMKGGYKVEQQVLRDQLVAETGIVRTGSETTSMRPTVSGVELKISCFTVRSVCFSLGDTRSAMEVTTSPAVADALARVIADSMAEFREGQKSTLREEAELKHAYATGNDPRLQAPAAQATDDDNLPGLVAQEAPPA